MTPEKPNLTTFINSQGKEIDSPPPKHLVIIFTQYVHHLCCTCIDGKVLAQNELLYSAISS